MIYQPKHINHKTNGTIKKILLVVLPTILLIVVLNVFEPVRRLSVRVVSPIAAIGSRFYDFTSILTKSFSDKKKLLTENEALMAELERLRLGIINDEVIRSENAQLRKELELKPTTGFVGGKIIARPPQIPLDSLFIDRGLGDNLEHGDFVLVSDKILIGRIAKVNVNTSMVALNSFPSAVFFGFINRTSEPIEVKGSGSGGMEAKGLVLKMFI